jgi:O-antigen ligase
MNSAWVLNLRRVVLVLLLVSLGLAVAWLPWKWAALLVMGGIALVGLLIRPQWALCLLAFAVPFGSIRELPLGAVNIGAAELLLALLVTVWLAQMVVARRIVLPRAALLLPLLGFLGAISLSTLQAVSLELSAKEIVKWLEVLLIYLFMAAEEPSTVPALLRLEPSEARPARRWVNETWARWVVWSLLAAGSAEALVGIYQFLRRVGPEGFVLFGRFMRSYGHFAQPNPFAGYLGLTIPLAYALSLEALETWSAGLQQLKVSLGQLLTQNASYLGCVAALGVMSLAMVMSWSRGGWVGIAAALLVVTVARSRRALIIALALGLCAAYLLLIGGASYLPPALVQRVADFLPYLSGVDPARVQVTDANFAVVERMAHWLAAMGMFSDHPWLGVGIGNYPVAYARYALGRWRDPLGHAHNYYLNIIAEAGVTGLAAYLILFAACLLYAWRVMRHAQGFWRAVALGVLGALVHLCVHNLFDNLFVHSMNVQLGLVLGLLAVADTSAGTHNAHRD